ncbi:MAG: hypothetical protein WCJ39_10875, partial [bacterium]
MKKLLCIIGIVACIATSSNAQMTDIYVTKDSTVVVNKLYAGSLSGSSFSTDSLHASSFSNVRFGAMATYQPTKWFAVKTLTMYQAETKIASWHIQQFWLKFTPTKKLSIEAGNMATLPTEQRPNPVSAGGQFETFSEGQIVGMTLNAKVQYAFSSDFKAGAGIAARNNKPEYSGMLSYKTVKLSGWYSQYNKKVGSALTLDFARVYDVLVWKQDQIVSNLFCLKLLKKADISLYVDAGYDLAAKKLVRGEGGLLKNFESKYIKGLFGLGYQYETKTI